MGSPPVFYQTGIVSSSLVPRFIPCVLSDRNYFLFASTWFHPLCSMRQELFPLRYYMGSPPVSYQTGIVSSSLVPGFNPCVLWDRNCFLFASTWVHPPVFYETGIVSSSLVPGFIPCVIWDRKCFLFASTWVHPLCFIRQELFALRLYLDSPPVFYQTGIVSSSLVPGFTPCVLSDRNCFLFASTWVHPLCFMRQELFPLR
jgi:hypothetical protein